MEIGGCLGFDANKQKFFSMNHEAWIDRSDRISNMPEPILHHILSFLPTQYVVRTSILSKRWRYLWASIPYLDFDLEDFCIDLERRSKEASIDKFTDFVKWVLIFRDVSVVQRFRFSDYGYCRSCDIDGWIQVAARRKVQELDLSIRPEESYCVPFCESLKVLKLNLHYGIFQLPASIGFRSLTTLCLVSLKFPNEEFARKLFSSCPLLEKLSMTHCLSNSLKVLDIYAVNLKHLSFWEYIGESENAYNSFLGTELKVYAPNLLSFSYKGSIARDYSLHKLSSLVEVSVQMMEWGSVPDEELGRVITNMIKGFYNAKTLSLSIVFLEDLALIGDIPARFPTFYNLKSLKLFTGVDKLYFDVIAQILKCSPNLEDLVVDVESQQEDCWDDYWYSEDVNFSCLRYNLKSVQFVSSGLANELEFVKFLLINGKVLEKMVIKWFADIEKQEEITQQVLTFPRASSGIIISFPWARIPKVNLATLIE